MNDTRTTRPLRFLRRGQLVSLDNVPPERTLLEVLREDLACTGTKEGCGEGDCGACTVVLGEPVGDTLQLRAINSCIRLAHSVDGMAVWTAEDLSADPALGVDAGHLHPVQQALVDCHASQCGFCTPGFVMSLFALYEDPGSGPVSRQAVQRALSGNLCRCTGYRPIIDAAQRMMDLPAKRLDRLAVRKALTAIAPAGDGGAYLQPMQLGHLLQLRAAHPQAQIVAGGTDVGLWVTKQHRQFDQILDLTRVTELKRIEAGEGRLRVGAAVTLEEAYRALAGHWPELDAFAARFAGLPVRNSGTLGGNVANGSPIGDSMPLLIALRAQVVLASLRGERALPLEEFYTGYRQSRLAADEVVAFMDIPLPSAEPEQWLRAYKISKRYDDDISALCAVFKLRLQAGRVAEISIGAGGVAATPARAQLTEAALQGQPWNGATVERAAQVLRGEFSPISDMRASADYRRQVLGHLLQRLWLQTQGHEGLNLESVGSGEFA
jgi:xanthine dehydrogenase small subunit